MIIGEHPLETGVAYPLRMILPTTILGKGKLDFNARSVWCQKDTNPDFYDIGFQMLNIAWEDRLVIEQLVDDYGAPDD